MRIVTFAAALLALAACQPETGPGTGPVSACGAERFQYRVGTPLENHAFRPGTRIIPPGAAVTMDHRPERLNVETDAAGIITRIYCG